MPTSPHIASVSPLWKVCLFPAWSPEVVERLTDNGCIKPGSPQAHKVPCSHGLLVDAALGQGDGARAGFHGASTALGRDRDKVRHRCQLWVLLNNSAEPEVTLPALPTFILKEGGEAQTHPGLPRSPQAGPPLPTNPSPSQWRSRSLPGPGAPERWAGPGNCRGPGEGGQ